MSKYIHALPVLLLLIAPVFAQPWIPDLGNGRFKNPIVFADYSDPDVIRVGDDFYLVASSFNAMPGIPILHSKDLVHWTIIGHVYDRLPFQKYDKPVHGEGSWAPSIRFHDGLFYVYFCTPYDGLFVATTDNPAGKWTLHQVASVELWEDPAPFWDEDGNAYLLRSKLRADILYIHRMSRDGKRLLDNGTIVFHDTTRQPTIEGPKLLKKDGYYYIFAPAGGVAKGWQTVLRSKSIYGPYEDRTVLHQGSTEINGPHQGGIVALGSGEWWFVHFQDRGVYGRILHLQPVVWKDGWPLIGNDIDNDGIGEPVREWAKPNVGRTYPVQVPQTSDEFDEDRVGPQWQWHANTKDAWFSLSVKRGSLRLHAVQNLTQNGNLWFVPNLLLQKFPAPAFSARTRIMFHPDQADEKSGLVVMGREFAFLALTKTRDGNQLAMYTGTYQREDDATRQIATVALEGNSCYLKVQIEPGGVATFQYSLDDQTYRPIGTPFQSVAGVWIGAKVGLFSINPNIAGSTGYADFEWFRIE